MWHYCTEIFDYLSLSAIITDKIFCVHGGLSPSINTLDQVRLLLYLPKLMPISITVFALLNVTPLIVTALKEWLLLIAERISNQQINVQQMHRYSYIPFVCMYVCMYIYQDSR